MYAWLAVTFFILSCSSNECQQYSSHLNFLHIISKPSVAKVLKLT